MQHANGTAPGYQHPMSVEEFREQGYKMVDFICDYYNGLDNFSVLPDKKIQPAYLREQMPEKAPRQGQSFPSILQDVTKLIIPGMTHWQSPNFFAYYPANSSFPGILGEMLSAALNIVGFSWRGCPAATDLETVVLDWMAKLLNLPPAFLASQPGGSRGKGGGCIQGTASEAAVCALLAGRNRALEGRPAADCLKLVAYSSDQAHSLVKKACMIANIHHVRLLPTQEQDDWALQGSVLEEAVKQDLEAGLLPFFVCATIGTTSTAAVDAIPDLGAIAQHFKLWLHVDAAYAGVAAMLPECSQYFEGLHLVDSFNTNAHKWMLTNFDCSLLWVQDSFHLKAALTLNPAFLQNTTNEYDYKDWQIPLGRRFRSLKLWFVLRTYGSEGLQAYLRHHISLAQDFAQRVEQDSRLCLAADQKFSLVCFKLKDGSREQNKALLERINDSGKAFIVHTEVGGEYILRLAIGSASTQLKHIDQVWELISREATAILSQS